MATRYMANAKQVAGREEGGERGHAAAVDHDCGLFNGSSLMPRVCGTQRGWGLLNVAKVKA